MGSRAIKAPLRWIIRLFVVHPLSSIALVVLAGISFVFLSGRVPEPFAVQAGTVNSSMSATTSVMPKGNLPAPAATESFMTGQATFNADMVWNALSNDLHESLAEQGATKDTIQEQLAQYKEQGRQMENITYIGGYAPGGGKSFYFYVASINQASVGQSENVFFAFTLDNQGKILMVE